MIIKNFKPFTGQHCETTAVGSLLYQLGLEYSEPMLFGLGQGLGFLFWNMKIMDFPFIGGRIKTDLITHNICRNLQLKLEVRETTSPKKAWKNVKEFLNAGKAVGLKLDCYHLEYFTSKIHFAGHYASIYGYDDSFAYLNDTLQQGKNVKTTLESLSLARNEKGPMASKNLSFTISKPHKVPPLSQVLKETIYTNAKDFLNPPISNFGYKGIHKTSSEIKKWFKTSKDIKKDFQTCGAIMERGGTGGSLFRNLYSDFLEESSKILQSEHILKASEKYRDIAKDWKYLSDLFDTIGETQDEKHVTQASELLINLSKKEKSAMEKLATICKS